MRVTAVMAAMAGPSRSYICDGGGIRPRDGNMVGEADGEIVVMTLMMILIILLLEIALWLCSPRLLVPAQRVSRRVPGM